MNLICFWNWALTRWQKWTKRRSVKCFRSWPTSTYMVSRMAIKNISLALSNYGGGLFCNKSVILRLTVTCYLVNQKKKWVLNASLLCTCRWVETLIAKTYSVSILCIYIIYSVSSHSMWLINPVTFLVTTLNWVNENVICATLHYLRFKINCMWFIKESILK